MEGEKVNYLIINGSPHKGNTWKLVEEAVSEIVIQDKEAHFKEIHLLDLQLPFCLGCSNCFRKGREYCPHFEKVNQIYTSMEDADGLIMCSTTYNMRETALLKNMFDHLCYLMHRPHFFTKKALFITTVGGFGANGAVKSISASLRAIGYNRCYSIKVGTASWNAYVPKDKEVYRVKKVTSKFVQDINSGKMHYQKTDVMIPYNLFRGMCRYYIQGTEYETVDGEYWTDTKRAHRAYDYAVPLHVYQRALGAMFCGLGRVLGKKMIVTYRK